MKTFRENTSFKRTPKAVLSHRFNGCKLRYEPLLLFAPPKGQAGRRYAWMVVPVGLTFATTKRDGPRQGQQAWAAGTRDRKVVFS